MDMPGRRGGAGIYDALMRLLKNTLFCPIFASDSNFNPRNTNCMSVVNPAKAGSSSLTLSPAISGKHFSKVSFTYEWDYLSTSTLVSACLVTSPIVFRDKGNLVNSVYP